MYKYGTSVESHLEYYSYMISRSRRAVNHSSDQDSNTVQHSILNPESRSFCIRNPPGTVVVAYSYSSPPPNPGKQTRNVC
jgi:hypothetical protein